MCVADRNAGFVRQPGRFAELRTENRITFYRQRKEIPALAKLGRGTRSLC
jgi:hypothetical protein